MNKTALAIRMLELLYSYGKLDRKQLSELLETTPRKIIDLKMELETAGYYIESTTGKNGGYRLKDRLILPTLNLTESQKKSLLYAYEYLKMKNDFLYQKELNEVIEKVKIVSNTDYYDGSIIYQKEESQSDISKDIIEKIEDCIQKKLRIYLEYQSLSSKNIKLYCVEPYWVIYFEKSFYLIGYEINKNGFRMFKLVNQRLKSMKFTNEKFIALDYKLDKIIGQFGLIKNELFQVEFLVKGLEARLLYERKIGINDKKEWIDDDTLKVETTVEGIYWIKKLLLSIIKDVEVISPTYLKGEIISDLRKGLGYYD